MRGSRHARECNRVHVTEILCTQVTIAINLGVAEPQKASDSGRSFSVTHFTEKKKRKKITTTESLILAQDER